MTAPTFSFTVTGATHDDVMAEANRVAKAYWGRHLYDVVEVSVSLWRDELNADVTTKQHMVAGGSVRRSPVTLNIGPTS